MRFPTPADIVWCLHNRSQLKAAANGFIKWSYSLRINPLVLEQNKFTKNDHCELTKSYFSSPDTALKPFQTHPQTAFCQKDYFFAVPKYNYRNRRT